jgi:hypothetical protein
VRELEGVMKPLDRTCDAFLDDRMSAAERARFEMRLVREPRLAAAVDLHREVETSVRRAFQAPDLSSLIGRIEAAAAQMRSGGRDAVEGTFRWLAAVATLLFVFLTLCASAMFPSNSANEGVEGPSMRGLGASFVEAIGLSLATVSAVMASGVRLRRDGKGQLLVSRFGSPTGVVLPSETQVLRTERHSILGTGCTIVVQTESDPVALIIVPKDQDPRPNPAPDAEGRRFFRRELARVVLYERTYATRAKLLFDCNERHTLAFAFAFAYA